MTVTAHHIALGDFGEKYGGRRVRLEQRDVRGLAPADVVEVHHVRWVLLTAVRARTLLRLADDTLVSLPQHGTIDGRGCAVRLGVAGIPLPLIRRLAVAAVAIS